MQLRPRSTHTANFWDHGFEPDPKNVYVVSPRDDEWVLERQASKRATSMHEKKSEALDRAMDLAERKNAMLLVYKADGVCQHAYDFRERAAA